MAKSLQNTKSKTVTTARRFAHAGQAGLSHNIGGEPILWFCIRMQKMTISAADEWAIHKRAVDVVFSYSGQLGTTIRYNSKLNNHEQVTEYAESLGAEMIVARYFGLDYDINDLKRQARADVGQGLEVRWTSYTGGNLIVYPNDRETDIAVLR
jgi:hypothetical protein